MITTDITDYLEDQGIGTVGTTIFESQTKDTPNNLVGVFDTGGLEPDNQLPMAEPTFQVYVRNISYVNGKAKVDSIITSLHQKSNITLVSGGEYYYYILLITESLYLGVDSKNRKEWTINFRTKIRR